MTKYQGIPPEKYKTCKHCGSKNTKELLSREGESINRYSYFGWCKDCLDTYYYSFNVDTVEDRKGRI